MTTMFNLINEPWILAMDDGGRVHEMSLVETFRRAHEMRALAGELPTQDAALLRSPLLAVLYAAVARPRLFKEDGDAGDALNLWGEIWTAGKFPIQEIESYLRQYEDRFWLFHPERPFYQVPDVRGTTFSASKLMGDISESGNKPRMFAGRTGSEKTALAYGEAARWLVYLNAFDDTSSKPSPAGKGRDSVGTGWPGRLGLMYAEGDSLFETLMFNWVLFDPILREVYPDGLACWESAAPRTEERVVIPQPQSPVELLTVQSRRISLVRATKSRRVTGFSLVHGDGFPAENAFIENMTPWRYDAKEDVYRPKMFDPARQLWRDFSALTLLNEKEHGRPPGIVGWISMLKHARIGPAGGLVRLHSAAVQYGDKNFFVSDVFSDAVEVNRGLLENLAESRWLPRIAEMIEKTAQAVERLGWFAKDLVRATGGSGNSALDGAAVGARSSAYSALDVPFRAWLAGIAPDADIDDTCAAWTLTLRDALLGLADQMVDAAGERALTGIEAINPKTDKLEYFNAFIAMARFRAGLHKTLGDVHE